MAYVPRLSQVTPTNMWQNPCWYGPSNGFYTRGNGLPNCTCYAYGRATELNGGNPVPGLTTTGDGGSWYNRSSVSLRAGNNANDVQLGDILVFGPTSNAHPHGHVSVVEEIHREASRPYVKVSESGYRRPLTSYPPSMNWYFHVGTHYIDTGFRDGWIRSYGYYLAGILRFLSDPGSPSYPIPQSWIHKPDYRDMTESDKQNNAILIYVQLSQLGWTLNAIAGFLGNAERESAIDPQATGTGGGGLVGWTPLSNYTIWSNYYGYTWYDGQHQIEFIDMGVTCTARDPYNPDGTPKLYNTWDDDYLGRIDCTYPEYKAATYEPEEMARIFCWGYERPNDRYARLDLRQQWARKWFKFLQGIDVNAIGPFITESEASEITPLNMPVWMLSGQPKFKLTY